MLPLIGCYNRDDVVPLPPLSAETSDPLTSCERHQRWSSATLLSFTGNANVWTCCTGHVLCLYLVYLAGGQGQAFFFFFNPPCTNMDAAYMFCSLRFPSAVSAVLIEMNIGLGIKVSIVFINENNCFPLTSLRW